MSRRDAHERIERELRQAKAETLGRIGERLDDVLRRLAALDRELERSRGLATSEAHGERHEVIAARNRLRDDAAAMLHTLIIQREAIGLVHHRDVADQYPLPPRYLDAG